MVVVAGLAGVLCCVWLFGAGLTGCCYSFGFAGVGFLVGLLDCIDLLGF